MSPPKKKKRNCICPLQDKVEHVFNPSNKPLKELEIIVLEQDELEVLYLCDGQDLNQEQAGEMMGVSRGTVQRLLVVARKKMIKALVDQKALVVGSNTPKIRTTDLGLTTSNHESNAATQNRSSCGSSNVELCQGPLSCPWRRKDDRTCSN